MQRRRRRRGARGRIPTPVYIGREPTAEAFTPEPSSQEPPIIIEPDELEAFRLVDLEELTQEEAGARMGVSRGTIWRLLQRTRKKVAQALTEGRAIQISVDQI
jgi:predicted DNA-binding protein (UPF0251 family)